MSTSFRQALPDNEYSTNRVMHFDCKDDGTLVTCQLSDPRFLNIGEPRKVGIEVVDETDPSDTPAWFGAFLGHTNAQGVAKELMGVEVLDLLRRVLRLAEIGSEECGWGVDDIEEMEAWIGDRP